MTKTFINHSILKSSWGEKACVQFVDITLIHYCICIIYCRIMLTNGMLIKLFYYF